MFAQFVKISGSSKVLLKKVLQNDSVFFLFLKVLLEKVLQNDSVFFLFFKSTSRKSTAK